MVITDATLITINNQVSSNLAPPLIEDQALLAASANILLINNQIVNTSYINYATNIIGHFSSIIYSNYSNYNNINSSIQFKGIKTVIIPILSLNNKTVNLYFTNVKYYLAIGLFNLISILQLFKKKASPVLTKDSISQYISKLKVNASIKYSLQIFNYTQ